MRRTSILSLALFSLLSFAGAAMAAETAPAAEVAVAAQPVMASVAQEAVSTPATEADAALCQFLDSVKTNVLESATAGYWCPPGHWYCQKTSQCAGFCGPGQDHFAVCEFGCCMCAG